MAKFIGSELQSGNWGEDFFIKKLIEYFDDSFVIYRNRPIFGAQFDVCLLAPKIGIIIFEVKGWKPDTIKQVKNGDSIVIKTINEDTGEVGEATENPTNQVRGYVYKMRNKIRQKVGKNPLVYGMVCFPNVEKSVYDAKGIDPVCEYEETILKDDLITKAAFMAKMNLCVKNHLKAAKYYSPFTHELMFRVRQIFETDLNIEDQNVENTDLVETDHTTDKAPYSIFAYIPHDKESIKHIERLANFYSAGTKLSIVLSDITDIRIVKNSIDQILRRKGLCVDDLNLQINFENDNTGTVINDDGSFSVFGCTAYCISAQNKFSSYIEIINGIAETELEEAILTYADKNSAFNVEQFKVEHCDITKNAVVRAGAGTGKTYTMISRIAFLCHMQMCTMREMANRIVMITFTDDAANQMEEKIKAHFNNYYLLTGDTDCLTFINQIEGMQISTIHSYAKKVISQLGIEFGYGNELSITPGDYWIKKIIADEVDGYVIECQKRFGNEYVGRLGMPIYQINRNILNMIAKLYNQSVDVASLTTDCFGTFTVGGNGELHELISTVVPIIGKKVDEHFRKEDKLHLSSMMSMLKRCIGNDNNVQRLMRMQTGRPQFMFVDEFQDTDDIQIEALAKIANLLQYKLFVVGDVKQCIYRFRGAKENAFEKLDYLENDQWVSFSLKKNYRTDSDLLNLFHYTFDRMGKELVGDEQLLIYGGQGRDKESGRLIGTKDYNSGLAKEKYYKRIPILAEQDRLTALFHEVKRQINLIREYEKRNGKRFSQKEREIAILVRENWQAEIIKKEGRVHDVDVLTNTGGDLYMSEPALDMLILANALLHYDEADYLYAFVSSNFIGGGVSKARMYSIRESEKKNGWKKTKSMDSSQAKELLDRINREIPATEDGEWSSWGKFVKALRVKPVLQVLRKVYQILKPWVNYGREDKDLQNSYRLNVDLLFEELIRSVNADAVSINSIVDVLKANIVSKKNVDSRAIDVSKSDKIIVRCVTVHKSKGLEYGAVILPYASFPINKMKRSDINVSVFRDKSSVRIGYQIKYNTDHVVTDFENSFFDEKSEKEERMREEARVLYVAMTRSIRSFSWITLENNNNSSWQNLVWEGI